MSDLNSDQQFYVYLAFCICFFLFLVFVVRNSIKVIRGKEFQNHKISIHICVLIATCLCIANCLSIIVYAHQPLNAPYGLCNFPLVMAWYFIFTAYLLALESWISIYQAVSATARRYTRKLQVGFVVCDGVLLAMLITSGSLYCYQAEDSASYNSSSDSSYTPGDYFYIVSLVVTALGISSLFAFSGFKILRKLKAGARVRTSNDTDNHLYLVTRRIVLISTTSSVGAFLAIFFAAIPYQNTPLATVAYIVQMFFEIILMVEILYVAKPKLDKEESGSELTEKSAERFIKSPSSLLTSLSEISLFSTINSSSQTTVSVKIESV